MSMKAVVYGEPHKGCVIAATANEAQAAGYTLLWRNPKWWHGEAERADAVIADNPLICAAYARAGICAIPLVCDGETSAKAAQGGRDIAAEVDTLWPKARKNGVKRADLQQMLESGTFDEVKSLLSGDDA